MTDGSGRFDCPEEGCSWWVPEGMEYLYERHKLRHVEGRSPFEDHATLPGEARVRVRRESGVTGLFDGLVELEPWGTLTDDADPGEVTVDLWSLETTWHNEDRLSAHVRLEHDAARELGERLLAAAEQAKKIEDAHHLEDTKGGP